MPLVNLTTAHMQALKLAMTIAGHAQGLTPSQRSTLMGAKKTLDNALAGKHQKFDQLREAARAGEADITAGMTMGQLGEIWIDEVITEQRIKQQSIDHYEKVLRYDIVPVLGDLTIGEITVGVLDRYLKKLSKTQPAGSRRVKTVLSQMLSLAVRHGAIASNPTREVGRLPKRRKEVVALSLGELDQIRRALREAQQRSGPGPRQTRTPADLFELLTATGCRIGEAVALRWQDIDFRQGTLTVRGTLVFLVGKGWRRQESAKSEAGHRTIFLPQFALEMLRERRAQVAGGHNDAVFATRTGSFLQPDNARRSLRAALKATTLTWVTPHNFRKTVATFLDGEGLRKEAAAQLGHANEDVTKMYYIAKPAMAPDVSEILERFRSPVVLESGDVSG